MRIRQVFAILAAANLLIVAYYAGMLRGENEHLGYDIGRFEMPPNPKLYHKSILMFRRHAEAFHGYLRYGEAGQRVFLYLPPGVALTGSTAELNIRSIAWGNLMAVFGISSSGTFVRIEMSIRREAAPEADLALDTSAGRLRVKWIGRVNKCDYYSNYLEHCQKFGWKPASVFPRIGLGPVQEMSSTESIFLRTSPTAVWEAHAFDQQGRHVRLVGTSAH